MKNKYYSQRMGVNPNSKGLPLPDVKDLFVRVFDQLSEDGYFHEAFGFYCVDADYIPGKIKDVELDMLLVIRKKKLWPISDNAINYSEDDFFDVLEYLFQHVSKPIDGSWHSFNECGMHWETFNQTDGRHEYREKINLILQHYEKRFELSEKGEVLQRPEAGFEPIFDADVPSKDSNVVDRINVATLKYRKHGSSIDERRQAVRDLADVLEYLRPKMRTLLTNKDENDLFNIANNFGIRHHNDKQKTSYDAAIWLSWMFYFYLSTIHVILRKISHDKSK